MYNDQTHSSMPLAAPGLQCTHATASTPWLVILLPSLFLAQLTVLDNNLDLLFI